MTRVHCVGGLYIMFMRNTKQYYLHNHLALNMNKNDDKSKGGNRKGENLYLCVCVWACARSEDGANSYLPHCEVNG